jgi:hypothetical protein
VAFLAFDGNNEPNGESPVGFHSKPMIAAVGGTILRKIEAFLSRAQIQNGKGFSWGGI